jgi:hypothetical protein
VIEYAFFNKSNFESVSEIGMDCKNLKADKVLVITDPKVNNTLPSTHTLCLILLSV